MRWQRGPLESGDIGEKKNRECMLALFLKRVLAEMAITR